MFFVFVTLGTTKAPKPPTPTPTPQNVRPVAVYPLSNTYKGRDSLRKAPTAYIRGVYPTTGPTGIPNTAYRFLGKSTSYIQFPNKGKLDTKTALTVVAWVYPVKPGPIFNYQTNGWGVHFWVTRPGQLFVRFMRRNGRSSRHVVYNGLRPRAWNYVAATYDKRTGRASLWASGRMVATARVGSFDLRTQYNVRMGARVGDGRYFKGRIACMQIYKRALRAKELRAVMYRCTKGKLFLLHVM